MSINGLGTTWPYGQLLDLSGSTLRLVPGGNYSEVSLSSVGSPALWSQYPAVQPVDIQTQNLNNVGAIICADSFSQNLYIGDPLINVNVGTALGTLENDIGNLTSEVADISTNCLRNPLTANLDCSNHTLENVGRITDFKAVPPSQPFIDSTVNIDSGTLPYPALRFNSQKAGGTQNKSLQLLMTDGTPTWVSSWEGYVMDEISSKCSNYIVETDNGGSIKHYASGGGYLDQRVDSGMGSLSASLGMRDAAGNQPGFYTLAFGDNGQSQLSLHQNADYLGNYALLNCAGGVATVGDLNYNQTKITVDDPNKSISHSVAGNALFVETNSVSIRSDPAYTSPTLLFSNTSTGDTARIGYDGIDIMDIGGNVRSLQVNVPTDVTLNTATVNITSSVDAIVNVTSNGGGTVAKTVYQDNSASQPVTVGWDGTNNRGVFTSEQSMMIQTQKSMDIQSLNDYISIKTTFERPITLGNYTDGTFGVGEAKTKFSVTYNEYQFGAGSGGAAQQPTLVLKGSNGINDATIGFDDSTNHMSLTAPKIDINGVDGITCDGVLAPNTGIADQAGSTGNDGQVLTSTGAGLFWRDNPLVFGSFCNTNSQVVGTANLTVFANYNTSQFASGCFLATSGYEIQVAVDCSKLRICSSLVASTASPLTTFRFWLRKNATNVQDTCSVVSIKASGDKVLTTCEWFVMCNAGDRFIVCFQADQPTASIFAAGAGGSGANVFPACPSIITTLQGY